MLKSKLFRLLCLCVCCLLLFGCGMWSSAEHQTVISYTVDTYYELVIPAGVSTQGSGTAVAVQASPLLPEGTRVTVSVRSAAGSTPKLSDKNGAYAYTVLCNGNPVKIGQTFLTQSAGAGTAAKANLSYRLDTDIPEEGIYTDTLTFRAAVAAE